MKLIKYGSQALAAAFVTILTPLVTTPLAAIAQTDPLPEDPSDPLISHGGDMAIYIGVALLVLSLGFAIKSLAPKLEHVLIFAFVLSLITILVLWNL